MALDLTIFGNTLLYSRTASPEQIRDDMRELARFDRFHEGEASRWSGYGTIAVIAAIAALIVAVAADSGGLKTVSIVLTLILGVVTAALFMRASTHKRQDLEDRRHELVANLVPLLLADMAPGAELDMSIDFNDSTASDKYMRTGEVRGWTVKYYRDPWLAIKGRFVDGTSFAISFVHDVQKRSKWKRSRSGKMKHKSKTKSKAAITVQVRAKPSKYPRLPEIADQRVGALQLSEKATLVDYRHRDHQLLMKASVSPYWKEPDGGSRSIAMMLLSMYQVLNLARAIDRGERAA